MFWTACSPTPNSSPQLNQRRGLHTHLSLDSLIGERFAQALPEILLCVEMGRMFSTELIASANTLIDDMRAKGLRLVTAESCTGGLLSGLLTEIPGSSDVLDRGFVTYSDLAKIEVLGVPGAVIEKHGAVSAAVALAMAEGALNHAHADIAVAVTGVAGPGGGTPQKPVGLVYVAAAKRDGAPRAQRFMFGDVGRREIRLATLSEALSLVDQILKD